MYHRCRKFQDFDGYRVMTIFTPTIHFEVEKNDTTLKCFPVDSRVVARETSVEGSPTVDCLSVVNRND